jgi:hypothetical protein
MLATKTASASDSPSWKVEVSFTDTSRVTKRRVSVAALCAIAMHLAIAATVAAEPRALIVPLSGSAPDELADAPDRLTRVLVRTSASRGAEVTVARASIEDTLAIVGCTAESATCLDQAAAVLEVDHIVFGRVEPGDEADTLKVTLTVARRGKAPVKRSFTLPAATMGEAEAALAGQAGPMLGAGRTRRSSGTGRPDKSQDPAIGSRPDGKRDSGIDRKGRDTPLEPGDEPDGALEGEPDAARDDGEQEDEPVDLLPRDGDVAGDSGPSRFDFDRVERSSWIIAGVGGGLMGTGTVFWLLAHGRQGRVNDAPASTIADLERLVALENGVRTRAFIGNTLFLAGTVTAAIGVTIAIKQARNPEHRAVTAAPMAMQDGVGVVIDLSGLLRLGGLE